MTYRPTPDAPPTVSVDAGSHAPAGELAVLRVHVRNVADAPRELTVTVLGLDAEWLPGPVRTGPVDPDVTATVEVPVQIAAGTPAGSYPFVVAVEVRDRPAARTVLDATLTVDPPSAIMLGVEPAETRARLGRKVRIVLSNSGAEDVPVTVAVHSDRGLRVAAPRQATVPARGTIHLPGRLRVRRPRLVTSGGRLSYVVTARSDRAPARMRGALTARPFLSPLVVKIAAVCSILALWAGGIGLGLPWLTTQLSSGDDLAAAEQPAGDAAAEPGADEPATEPVAEEPGDEASEDPVGGTRIAGRVTGTDPAGVRVDIAPASVLDLAPETPAVEQASAAGHDDGLVLAAGPGPLAAGPGPLAAEAPPAAPPTGKVPGTALPVTRTAALDVARSTMTQEDGGWAFAGMSPTGNYLVTLSKPGYQTQRFVVSGGAAQAALEVELTAGAGRLSGTVQGPDGPTGGVDITITDGTTTVTTSSATTGDVGSWAVDGLSTPSTYVVTAVRSDLGAQTALVELGAGGRERLDLTLSDSQVTLTGTVTGPNSLGAVGGLGAVTVTATDGSTTRTASTTTGERGGGYVLPDLPVPGTYTVTVSAPGYAEQSRELRLTAATTPRSDFRLGVSSGVVQGAVTLPDGAGLGSVGLTLRGAESTYKTMTSSDLAGTGVNEAGAFRLSGIEPGEYVLEAVLFGHLTGYASLTVAAGRTVTSDLVLTPVDNAGLESTARIRGQVSDANTNGQITCPADVAEEDCLVTVTLTAQQLEDGSTRQVTATTAPGLEYTIPSADEEGLLPGLYTLSVEAPGYEPGRTRVQVGMGTASQAGPVALYPSPSISGTIAARVGSVPADTCVVVTPAGAPVPGDCIIGTAATGTPTCTVDGAGPDDAVHCAPLGANGSYVIERLAAGTWSVSVHPPSGSEYLPVPPVNVSAAPGETRRYDATVDRLARLSLTVLSDDRSGTLRPVEDAQVTVTSAGGGAAQVAPGGSGSYLVTHLAPGDHRIEVTSADGALAARTEIAVSNNQEVTNQVVLTGGAPGTTTGRVLTQLGQTASRVAGATVEISGVVGYDSLRPRWASATVTTDSDGYFTVGPDPDPAASHARLALVNDQVNVHVSGPDYLPLTRQGVRLSELGSLVVEPRGVRFRGSLQIAGHPGAVAGSDVRLTVTEAPPGADGAMVTALGAADPASPTFDLLWSDLAQPLVRGGKEAGSLAESMIRPGTYELTASLPGYRSATVRFTVPVGGWAGATPDAPPVFDLDAHPTDEELVLERFAQLRIAVVEAPCTPGCTPGQISDPGAHPVRDAVVTLTDPAGSDTTLTPAPGGHTVNAGQVPPGTYRVTARAAGYAFDEGEITVLPGQTTPVQFAVTKLGAIIGTVQVVDGDGRTAVPGVEVTATSDTGTTFRATTDAAGQYTIRGTSSEAGLRSGSWTVSAAVPGYEPSYHAADGAALPGGQVTVSDGPSTVVDVQLDPNAVRLHIDVWDPQLGAAVADVSVTLYAPGGTAIPTAVAWTDSGQPYFVPVDPADRHVDLNPGTYTVEVQGENYAATTVTVTIDPLPAVQTVTVPIAGRSNVVAGVVTGRDSAGTTLPVDGARVELWDLASYQRLSGEDALPTGTACAAPGHTEHDPLFTDCTDQAGGFRLDVPDATYVIRFLSPDFAPATRTVAVSGGQVHTLEVVLSTRSTDVTVALHATADTDLSGAVVSLTGDSCPAGGSPAPAPQPATWTAGSLYATTFHQVAPCEEWTAQVAWPSGHLGTYTGSVSGSDDVRIDIEVAEIELRLVLDAESGAPLPLDLEISGSPTATHAGFTAAAVELGRSPRVLYLPAGSYEVAAESVDTGWELTPASATITASSELVLRLARETVDPVPTAVTVEVEHAAGSSQALLTAAVEASGGAPVTTGFVSFYRAGNIVAADVPLSAAGTATVTPATTGWGYGPTTITARYHGAAEFLPSESEPQTLVVRQPTAVQLAVCGWSSHAQFVQLTVTPEPAAAAGRIEIRENGDLVATLTGPDTVVRLVEPGNYTYQATFQPTDGDRYLGSQATATIEVAADVDTC